MNRIKKLRTEKNITQEVLGKLLGLEIAGISKLETGRVPLKDEYILKLSEYFEVTTDFLLGKSDKRNCESDSSSNLITTSLSTKDYLPPNEKQQKQIDEYAKLVLEDNKKDTNEKNIKSQDA